MGFDPISIAALGLGLYDTINKAGQQAKSQEDLRNQTLYVNPITGETLGGFEYDKWVNGSNADLRERAKGFIPKAQYDEQQLVQKNNQWQSNLNQAQGELQKVYEAGIAEKDAAGNLTELGKYMQDIRNDYMTNASRAITNWAAERGVSGSSIEAQQISNASNEAQTQASGYRQSVQNQLYGEKEDLWNKLMQQYGADMNVPAEVFRNSAAQNSRTTQNAFTTYMLNAQKPTFTDQLSDDLNRMTFYNYLKKNSSPQTNQGGYFFQSKKPGDWAGDEIAPRFPKYF